MRTDLHLRNTLTVDVYDYTIKDNGDGTTSPDQYFFKETLTVRLGNNADKLFTLVYSDVPLKRLSHLREVKDSNGDLLYPGQEFEVRTIQPLVDIFGQQSGYRHRVVPTS